MKTGVISDLFEDGGLIIHKSKNESLYDLQYKDIVRLFEKYGFILFRGFELNGEEITKFTDIYTQAYSGDALRREIRFNNKNIRNVDYGFSSVDLHSEASFAPSWPELIWFYCNIPPKTGGETILCDGIKIWDNLSAETKGFFLGEQIHYQLKIPVIKKRKNSIKKPWLVPVVGAGNGFVTNVDGCLHLVQKRYAVQASRLRGRFAFANHLFINLESESQLLSRTLSNKREIPSSFFKEAEGKAYSFTYIHSWEKNDLLMLDNKRFLHGRKSLTKGDPRDIVIVQSQYASFGYGSTTRKSINYISESNNI